MIMIELRRIALKAGYTIGRMYIDGQYFCDTLEDTDRGINMLMPLHDIQQIKIKGKTAVPTGEYQVVIDYSCRFKKNMPHVLAVPGFEGIRIHPGNTAEDTEGCILLGENKTKGKVVNSRAAFLRFMSLIKMDKNIKIKIL